MSETWLKPGITDSMVHFQDYVLLRCDRLGRGGGGVGAYVHTSINARLLATSECQYQRRPEYLFLEISIPNLTKVLIAVVYRPPKAGYLKDFENKCLELFSHFKNLIIMGDFNSNMLADDFNALQIHEFVESSDFHLVPFQATHHTSTSSTFLDLCIIDGKEKLREYGQCPVPFLSAHDLIFICLHLRITRSSGTTTKARDFRNLDAEAFLDDLSSQDWSNFPTIDCVDEMLTAINCNLVSVLDRHAPIREIIQKRPPAPFSLIREAKKEHYLAAFNCKRKIAFTWGELKRLGLIGSSVRNNRCNFDLDVLNNAFILSSSPHPVTQSMCSVSSLLSGDCGRFDETELFFADISPKALITAILKGRSEAMGVDNISTKCLKLALASLLPYLLRLFNHMLQGSLYPNLWKSALIRPLPKTKFPGSSTDFRPISLLCTLSKALERIVFDQITDYLEANNLFDDHQSAYRKGFSTQTAALRVT
ncbi:rna-directed dna polymerase from mobile element jockey-like protein, partial [Lasius niger]